MRAALERAALLLILTLALLADGLMEAFGPGVFILISAITLSAAEALRLLAGIKKGPLHHRRPKPDARDPYQPPHWGLGTVIVPWPPLNFKKVGSKVE